MLSDKELRLNLDAFYKLDPKILETNSQKFALLHGGALVDIYNDLEDTYKIAREKYPENDFFIRQIDAPELHFGTLHKYILTI